MRWHQGPTGVVGTTVSLENVRVIAQLVVFAAVTVQAGRLARRYRQALWVAAAFAALTVISAVSLFAPAEALDSWSQAGRRAQALLIAAVPYFVWRFAATVVRPPRSMRTAVNVGAAALAVATIALPEFPGGSDQTTAMQDVYVGAFLVYWPVTFALTAMMLWRAGRDEGHLANRRMLVLAIGAAAMGVSLLLSTASGGGGGLLGVGITVAVIGAGLAFYIGFAPPGWLKAIWRQRPIKATRDMQTQLMAAATRQEVARAQVPYIHELIGLPAMFISPEGEVVASAGIDGDEVQAVATKAMQDPDPSGVLVRPLQWGQLVLAADFRAPLFADEERELLDAMVHQLNLGLDRARLYDTERAARDEAERARREVQALLAGIIHDVKTPTATISGYVELLRELRWQDADPDETERFLSAIGRSAGTLNELARDLVALARADQVEREPQSIELVALVREVAGDVSAAHPHLSVEVADDLPEVYADPSRLRQLFTNLLTNAAVHAGPGPISVAVTAVVEDDDVILHVTDDGAGIPEEDLDRIFDLFTRGSTASADGSGIGLAICQRIVRTVGGTITVDNVPGGGARFTVTMQHADRGADATESADSAALW